MINRIFSTYKFEVLLTYEHGETFLLIDTYENIHKLLRNRQAKYFGTQYKHALISTNYPVELNDFATDLFIWFQNSKAKNGEVHISTLSKERRTQALINIIPSGDTTALRQQIREWERNSGWNQF